MLGTDTTAGPGDGQTTYTRSWVATDSCGNSSDTCSQSIVEEPCGDICTFTIGGWGSRCPDSQADDMLSTQPGCIRDHYFALVFPSGVTIGDPAGFGEGNPNFYSARWTSSAAVEEFLPTVAHLVV